MGWWQGEVGSCGTELGWRTFTSATAGYHCCTDFPAQCSGSNPTQSPVVLDLYSFMKASPSYEYESEQDAAKACTDLDSSYQLCSASQIVEVVFNGGPADDDNGFLAVGSQLD